MLNLREHPADGKLGWLLLWLRLRPARARSHAGSPPARSLESAHAARGSTGAPARVHGSAETG